MDTTTLQWYDENAAALADKWEATAPRDLHSLFTRWIRPGMAVLELGCGSPSRAGAACDSAAARSGRGIPPQAPADALAASVLAPPSTTQSLPLKPMP